VLKGARLFLGENHDLPCSFGKPLKHGLSPLGASRRQLF
jgi:hypothetical protein